MRGAQVVRALRALRVLRALRAGRVARAPGRQRRFASARLVPLRVGGTWTRPETQEKQLVGVVKSRRPFWISLIGRHKEAELGLKKGAMVLATPQVSIPTLARTKKRLRLDSNSVETSLALHAGVHAHVHAHSAHRVHHGHHRVHHGHAHHGHAHHPWCGFCAIVSN